MKAKFFPPLVLLLMAVQLQAQQQSLYTQFMYQKIAVNPGYAGSMKALSATLLHRSQWLGFEGAPTVQSFSLHGPLKESNIGLGGFINHVSVGVTSHTTLNGIYSYKLKTGKTGNLRLGISPSIRYYLVDFTDPRLQATEPIPIDNALSNNKESKFLANIGFGAYYSDDKLFLGASLPRLAESDIDFDQEDLIRSKEVRHLYLMGGYEFTLNEQYSLTPQALLRFAEASPFDMDLNVMLGYREKLFLGATYRHYYGENSGFAESMDILLGLQVAKVFYIGLSYDIGFNDLANYHNGSIEIALRYLFVPREEKLEFDNPRFF